MLHGVLPIMLQDNLSEKITKRNLHSAFWSLEGLAWSVDDSFVL
jgi:hypothetical protein